MKWFKHDSDAFTSEGISAIIDEFGFAGYGRWNRILELVAFKMDNTDRCHVEYPVQKWCQLLGLKRKQLTLFLEATQKQLKTNVVYSEKQIRIEIPNLLKKREKPKKENGKKTAQEVEVELDLDLDLKKEKEKEKEREKPKEKSVTKEEAEVEFTQIKAMIKPPMPTEAFIARMEIWKALYPELGIEEWMAKTYLPEDKRAKVTKTETEAETRERIGLAPRMQVLEGEGVDEK